MGERHPPTQALERRAWAKDKNSHLACKSETEIMWAKFRRFFQFNTSKGEASLDLEIHISTLLIAKFWESHDDGGARHSLVARARARLGRPHVVVVGTKPGVTTASLRLLCREARAGTR